MDMYYRGMRVFVSFLCGRISFDIFCFYWILYQNFKRKNVYEADIGHNSNTYTWYSRVFTDWMSYIGGLLTGCPPFQRVQGVQVLNKTS